ncbi:AOC03_06830 family ribosome hibernation factor [Kaistella palustris]|uniref:AOC03_06830 family ribosome hibernation factor n=1 Tax=Kaistella palustris TaxID=493376 RepID=UPI00040C5EC7|nr:hypothetical protein [Kaistella palustris]
MNTKFNELQNAKAKNCVTIILNTHRTLPDNEKDPLLLKNLLKDAEEQLLNSLPKKDADSILDKLTDLEAAIDHRHNLESLLLFVNAELGISEYVRLPFGVTNRVVIGDRFATRDLLRARNKTTGYYVLVLSQQKIRFMEAENSRLVKEFTEPFPVINTDFQPEVGVEGSNANRQTNLIAEFFNRTDKEVNKIRATKKLPVLICSEEENYYEYLKIADEKDSIYQTFVKGNRLDEKAESLVENAWPLVKEHIKDANLKKLQNVKDDPIAHNLITDITEIYRAVQEGRVQTLFVEAENTQPAKVENSAVTLLNSNDKLSGATTADIYDDLLQMNTEKGGDAVFLPAGSLKDWNGLGALLRY